jgi:hypothetical protein
MIRLLLGGSGLVLSLKLFVKSQDQASQLIALLFLPIFVFYVYKALEEIKEEK